MREPQMEVIAHLIDEGVRAASRGDETSIKRIAGEVRELAAGFQIPGGALQ